MFGIFKEGWEVGFIVVIVGDAAGFLEIVEVGSGSVQADELHLVPLAVLLLTAVRSIVMTLEEYLQNMSPPAEVC